MESDIKFSLTLLKKERILILTGMGVFLPALFFTKASFSLSVTTIIFYIFLLIIGIFDARYGLIFDKILICFMSAFLILFCSFNDIFPPITEGFLTAISCSVFLTLIQIISKNGIGGGDIKLIFCLSFWLGFYKLLLAFYIAVFSALIAVICISKFRKRGALIPFGVFISFGSIISFLYGEKIMYWFGEFFL
ncbi:MAG: prepilin peptidase [Selenomonadaceae bacterium]|nr:prepilin peptidase [Selenomonadaceae bacterium]